MSRPQVGFHTVGRAGQVNTPVGTCPEDKSVHV